MPVESAAVPVDEKVPAVVSVIKTEILPPDEKSQNPKSIYYQEDEYWDEVERQANSACQMRDLRGEAKLLRATTLEMLKKFRTGTGTKGFVYVGKNRVDVPVDDVTKAKMICELTRAIGTLIRNDQEIAKENFISRNNFRIWLANLAREIKLAFPRKADQDAWVKISQKVGEPISES